MHKIVLTLPILSVFMVVSSSLAAPPDLASMDWSVNPAHTLAKNPPARKMVWDFINHFRDDTGGRLCSFRFVDLRHLDELSLVAVYDGGGSVSCNQLTIFDKSATGFEAYDYSDGLQDADVKDQSKMVETQWVPLTFQ